jgi:F0F1-type ATP synthase membrane subunit b/b'
MMRQNFAWVHGMGLVAMVFAVAVLVITAGLQWTSVQAYATERGEERKDARDTKQAGREEAKEQKAECKAGDDKSRAECRQDKRDTKQDARESARDIKRK